jgi:hypothetical protein
VRKGELLPEETSVLTNDKSMVRLKFLDGTTVNLGPTSKIVITDLPKVKANVISLLTGTINASVKKSDNDKTKLLVKTKNSVMGVRGTKLKIGFNPENSNTSLVTIEGNVAMSKVKNEQEAALVHDSERLDENLNNSEIVEVKAGKFSDVRQEVVKPSIPVKIAPIQYDILAKQMGSKSTAQEVMKTDDAQGEIDNLLDSKDSKQVVHRPGGYVDFSTGLYVAPTKDAIIDKNTGTYKATRKIGNLDAAGEYQAPKGIKLDAKKGFILASNSQDADPQVLENLKELKEENNKPNEPWIEKHILALRIEPILSSFEADGDYYKSEDSSNFRLSYEQIWNDKWESGIFIGNKEWKLAKPSKKVRDHDGGEGEYSMIDIRYNFTPTYTFGLSFISESFPVIQEDPYWDEYSINLESAQGVSPHFTFKFSESHFLNLRYKHFFEKDVDLMSFNSPGSYRVAVNVKSLRLTLMNSYKFLKSFAFIYDVYYEASTLEVEDRNDANMNTLGLSLGVSWTI